MSWYAILFPSAATAVLVRLDAIFIGPYWSWIQLVPTEREEDEETAKLRRRAFLRRVTLPFLVSVLLVLAWPGTYSPRTTALVGGIGAALVLWPLAFNAYSDERSRPVHIVIALYLLFVFLYVVGGYVGGGVGAWIRDEHGSVFVFFRDRLFESLLGGGLLLFGSDMLARLGGRLTRIRDDEWQGMMMDQ